MHRGWVGAAVLSLSELLWASPGRAYAGDEPSPVSEAEPAPEAPEDVALDAGMPEACPGRYLVLTTGPEIDAALAQEIRVDLEVELGRRGMSVCTGEGPEEAPLALVSLRLQDGVLSIELDDRATQKRVARDLRLSSVPETGRALAAAIAVDELLRASWAELTMGASSDKPPEQPEEREPKALPAEPSIRLPVARPRYMLALSSGYTHGRLHLHSFSTSLRGSLFPLPYVWLEAALGGFRTRSHETYAGEVYARGLTSDFSLGTCPWQTARGFVCLGGRLGIDWLAFRPEAYESTTQTHVARTRSIQLGGVASVGMGLPHQLMLFFQSVWGAGVDAAVAKQGGERLLGTDGFLWTGILGLGVVAP